MCHSSKRSSPLVAFASCPSRTSTRTSPLSAGDSVVGADVPRSVCTRPKRCPLRLRGPPANRPIRGRRGDACGPARGDRRPWREPTSRGQDSRAAGGQGSASDDEFDSVIQVAMRRVIPREHRCRDGRRVEAPACDRVEHLRQDRRRMHTPREEPDASRVHVE